MSNRILNILLLFIIFFASCKKEKKEYDISPQIEFVSISPNPVNEYQPVYITFKYTDGDGDIGENDANAKNLFVTDNRIGIVYSYRIQQLSPDNEKIPITGNLEAKIDNAVITNGAASQSVTYTVYIVDRAGNMSNTITTPAVNIVK